MTSPRPPHDPYARAARLEGRVLRPRALSLDDYPRAARSDFFVRIFESATGQPTLLPIIVARGAEDGPTVGITAAVHGNELNGIRIVHQVLEHVDLSRLRGALLCCPIVNVPAFNLQQRFFSDGRDLNHHFPGKEQGVPVEQYARAFVRTFLPACDYLVDIHTASQGRVNTMYVRADLHVPAARQLAEWMNPEIILHVRGGDGTLRHAARVRKIPAVTIEAGNPSAFQGRMVLEGAVGLTNILTGLGLIDGHLTMTRTPVVCHRSQWIRTQTGGLLDTQFHLGDRVEKGQVLARTLDPFGYVLREYRAPFSGIVIGMARNPLAVPGTRFCHLGAVGEPPPRGNPPIPESPESKSGPESVGSTQGLTP